jgi:hypothetical protein
MSALQAAQMSGLLTRSGMPEAEVNRLLSRWII